MTEGDSTGERKNLWRVLIGVLLIAAGGWLLVNVIVPVIESAEAVADLLTPDLYDSCEVLSADSSYGVRVESYINGSNPLLYLTSSDGGTTWREFARYNGDSGAPPADCDKITFIGDMAYFAEWSVLHVTQDAGETWFEAWARPSGSRCYSIESVGFDDAQSGTLALRCYEDTGIGGTGTSYTATLLTTDGGETWVDTDE